MIRGCYRRSSGAAIAVPDDAYGDDEGEPDEAITSIKARSRPKASKTKSKKGKGSEDDSSEGEFFDLDGVSSTDEGSQDSPSKPRKRPRKLSPIKEPSKTVTSEAGPSRPTELPKRVRRTTKATIAATKPSKIVTAEAGPSRLTETPKRAHKTTKTAPEPSETITAEAELSRPIHTPKRVRTTTKTTATKSSETITAEAGPSRPIETPKKVRKTIKTAVAATKTMKRKYHTDIDALARRTSSLALDDSESGEFFDFGGIESGSSGVDEPL